MSSANNWGRWLASWTLYWIGDVVSRSMNAFDWWWLYRPYNWLMSRSFYIQGRTVYGPWGDRMSTNPTLPPDPTPEMIRIMREAFFSVWYAPSERSEYEENLTAAYHALFNHLMGEEVGPEAK